MIRLRNIFFVFIFIFLSLMVIPAWAMEEDTEYIVQFKEPMLFMAEEAERFAPVIPDKGIYKTDKETAQKLEAAGLFSYIEPDAPVYLAEGEEEPRDPLYPQQWNLSHIGIPSMWQGGYDASDIRIGIIDSGVSTIHEDLKDRIVGGYSFIDDNTDYNDTEGHGSFIAGIIGASSNNGLGITGGSNAKLYALKAFDGKETQTSIVAKAIDLAVNTYHCHIINLSFTSPTPSKTLENAVQNAVSKGVIVIAASGNQGNNQVNYPAAYDGVIGIGSINQEKKISSFSNRNDTVDAVLPGEGIISTYIKNDPIKGYAKASGTSYAAPHMALAAAYLKELDHSLTSAELEQLIKNYSEDLGTPGYDPIYGWGAVSLDNFYQKFGGLDVIRTGTQDFRSSFFNYTGRRMDAIHIWALYEEETGMMLDMSVEDMDLAPMDITYTEHTFLQPYPDTPCVVKSIWLNSWSDLIPLSDVKIYRLAE